MAMRFVKEHITPERAEEFLKLNVTNRPFRKTVARDYANEILAGEWEPDTGETIKFNTAGRMFDGQHRCHGIIMAGKGVDVWVVYDAPESAFSKVDTGLKRTGGDVLQIEGARYAVQIAGIIRRYLLLKSGKGFAAIGGSQNRGIHNHDILHEFKRRKKFWNACNEQTIVWYQEISHAMTPSEIGGYYAYLSEIDGDKASLFFTKLCSGTNIKARSPIRFLRSYLLNSRGHIIVQRKFRTIIRAGMILKAWSLFKNNTSVDKLSFNPEREDIPSAK